MTAPHRVYRLADGRIVPSVTQVLSIIAKPQLVPWANKLGLEGKSADAVRRETAARGTEVHAMIAAHLAGERFPATSSLEVALAFEGYLRWQKRHDVEPIFIEEPFVSKYYEYGGTIDLVAKVDGEVEVVDFKTTNRIYEDQFYQLAAYHHLVTENTELVPWRLRIVRLGTEASSPSYETAAIDDMIRAFGVFHAALRLYRALEEAKETDDAFMKGSRLSGMPRLAGHQQPYEQYCPQR